MKIAHYQYVGWPRAGSTFVHNIFRKNPLLQDCATTVFKEKACRTLDDYEEYRQFDYSINMDPMTLWNSDSSIRTADSVTTKFFACVRNPYDWVSSAYTFSNGSIDIQDKTDYAKTLTRFRSLTTRPFKLFFFDDLIANTPGFVNSIHNYLELTPTVIDLAQVRKLESSAVYHDLSKAINVSARTAATPCVYRGFSNSEIVAINHTITKFEDYVGRDFSHWKR
jgi:hypothetical protein